MLAANEIASHKDDDIWFDFDDRHLVNLIPIKQKTYDQAKPKAKHKYTPTSGGSKRSRVMDFITCICHHLPAFVMYERGLEFTIALLLVDNLPLPFAAWGDIRQVHAELEQPHVLGVLIADLLRV